MDAFTLSTSYRVASLPLPTKRTTFSFSYRPPSFVAFASKDEPPPQLDEWEQMEVKFGRLLGEDPKLTLAKIAARKEDPNASFLEIEKLFQKKKFQLEDEIVEEFPKRPPSDLSNLARPVPKKGIKFEEDLEKRPRLDLLNLARPVPKKGIKFEEDLGKRPPSDLLNLARPVPKEGIKFEENFRKKSPLDSLNLARPVPKNGIRFEEDEDKQFGSQKSRKAAFDGPMKQSSIPDVILRKPSAAYPEDDIEVKKSTRLKIKPNLLLKKNQGENKESFSDLTLLKRPEPTRPVSDPEPDPHNIISGDSSRSASGLSSEASNDSYESLEAGSDMLSQISEIEDKPTVGLQPLKQRDLGLNSKGTSIIQPEVELQGKPPRFDRSSKDVSEPVKEEAACLSSGKTEVESFMSAEPLKECEATDWSKAEYAYNTGGREVVELISCSTRGFVASFGSLVGFLPYRNLGAKWRFFAFETWLRMNGIDPAKYRQNLGVVGRHESLDKDSHNVANITSEKVDGKLSPNMKLEDLLSIYDQEKIKFLSSFIGLRFKVNFVLADRKSRKLIFSGKPKEDEELIRKRRSLMDKLNVGDVVKCRIQKITYFGIFVDVEEVRALIHQSEVSWDATLDPSSLFKIGQIVEAKVHQLDFSSDRILLSLREIMPDPMIETLDSVVGNNSTFERSLEVAQEDTDWAEVETLVKELEDIDGVQSVSKGRYFRSPGLAPTFQVYMASIFQNQYKLLARSGNKVQEVIVQASLDREEMKTAILACTNRVE